MSTSLGYDVFISDQVVLHAPPLPDGGLRTWAPLATTLVFGAADAVLIDPPLTSEQAVAVGDWVESRGRRLTHILITHGHGDHWFTAATLAKRFPGAVVAATPGTIREMARTQDARAGFWDVILPGLIPESEISAETLDGDRLRLEGHEVTFVGVGHSDSDDTSVVHVPDVSLVIAGDVVYDGVHQFLVDSGHGGRDAWREALDIVEALNPAVIVAGHARRGGDRDATRLLAATRRYLDDADQLLETEATAAGFVRAMLDRHPGDLNPSTLFGSADALYADGGPGPTPGMNRRGGASS